MHKQVFSARLHPPLCALTSADVVGYAEQRESDGSTASGKFRSMLIDIFGRTYPENVFWTFDRNRVAAYKAQVRRNTDAMRAHISEILG